MTLKEAMKSIKPASQALRQQAKQRWDQVAKPLGSLGAVSYTHLWKKGLSPFCL